MCDGWGEAMKHPCKPDCPDRSGECHSVCPKWAIYERYKREEYHKRKVQIEAESALFDGKERIKMRNYKRNKEWR